MATPTQKSNQIVVLTKEERIALESQHEVLLLLTSLAEREETTVKLILARLYDLGALNIISKKLRSRTLKKIVGGLAKLTKPAFKVVGFYWFKRNCPQLITNWLVDRVAFETVTANPAEVVPVPNSLESPENSLEIIKLRSKVRLLTRLLAVVITVFGVSFAWLFYSLKIQPSSSLQPSEYSTNCLEN